MKQIEVLKLNSNARIPERYNSEDAGLDIFALEDTFIPLGTTAVVKTGIALNVPTGYMGKVFDRSSMGAKGLAVGAGVIDVGYSGPINVVLHNLTNKLDNNFIGQIGYQIKAGDKVAQFVLLKIETPNTVEVTRLWSSERGSRGFGSSGG